MSDYEVRDISVMAEEAPAALEEGGRPGFPLIDGRAPGVHAPAGSEQRRLEVEG